MEQAAARAGVASRGGGQNKREVCGGLHPSDRASVAGLGKSRMMGMSIFDWVMVLVVVLSTVLQASV